jgi:hypothetical protein
MNWIHGSEAFDGAAWEWHIEDDFLETSYFLSDTAAGAALGAAGAAAAGLLVLSDELEPAEFEPAESLLFDSPLDSEDFGFALP